MKTDSPLLETNDGFLVCQPEAEINQPSGSIYLMDIFDKDLMRQIDTQLMDSQVFFPQKQGVNFIERHPYFQKLKEIRVIPAIETLLDRKITQFVKVDSEGYFSFFISKVNNAEQYPFLCSEETSADRSFRLILPRMIPLAILFHEFVRKYPGNSGIVPFSHGDAGRGDGSVLCYSSNQKNHKLIPDSDYLYRHAYSDFKEQLKSSYVRWEKRKPVVYWRGSSTGKKSRDNAWREMPRFQLCQFALDSTYKDLFDIKITRITNRFTSPEVIQEIKDSGFIAPYEPATDQVKYKYLIDINGHVCNWTGVFLRLLTGSPLIRVISSDGYKQWFYDRLIPWENYIPVKEDLSDLQDVVVYLKNHDQKAKAIGEAGKKLAFSMTLENEIEMALPVIRECLQDNKNCAVV